MSFERRGLNDVWFYHLLGLSEPSPGRNAVLNMRP